MPDIKLVETKYNGHRFRSRLEARWAVFFDKLGVTYEYELADYQLPSGKRYLPDFRLPDLGLHVDIKPTEQITYAELQKLSEFALDEDNPLLFIAGTPTNERMYLINRRTIGPLSELQADYEGQVDQAAIIVTFFELLADWGNVTFGVSPSSRGWSLVYKTLPPNDDHHLQEALLTAKQSQFGESG